MMQLFILLLPVLLPACAGLYILLRRPGQCGRMACLAALLCCLTIFPAVRSGAGEGVRIEITYFLSLILRADRLGIFFMVLIAAAFFLALVYACEYLGRDKRQPVFFGFTLMTLGAMMGLCLAGNLITFYMFFELMGLLSFPLVLYSGGEEASLAAMKYLGFSVFGASLVLMGMILGGGLPIHAFGRVGQMALDARQLWAFLLIALGFSCKAGMMPMANWLPTAHPVAPAPASALLSGIITKAGILGMMRAAFYVFGGRNLAGTFPQTVLLVLSIATIFAGSMLAYKEKQFKKRLAYSSVSQLSYVIFGMMLCTPAGVCGALLQVVFHACAKIGLFLCAGAFIHHCDVHNVDGLLGMGRRMPRVMAAFTCFALSLIGIPPFGGFAAKWQLAAAALEQGSAAAQTGLVVLMVSALLTAGYLLPIVARGYFPGEGFKAKVTDGGPAMVLPMVVLAGAAALLGIFPAGLASFFRTVASAMF